MVQKTPASIILNLCKYTKMLRSHVNIHDYYSMSIIFYQFLFFSLFFVYVCLFPNLFHSFLSPYLLISCLFSFKENNISTNPPNISQPPQAITTHDIPITKSTKNKRKSNLQRKTQQL